MFAFSRHNYYVQEKLHSMQTPEEQHASPHRGNRDVRQYFYNIYVKSARTEKGSNVSHLLKLKPSATNILHDATR